MPLIFDVQRVLTCHLTDFVRAYSILSRSIPNSGKFFRRNGNQYARPTLAEQSVLGSHVFRHPHTRSEPCCRKARFRHRHRYSPVAHIMRRFERPFGSKRYHAIDHPFLCAKLDRRRFPRHNPANRASPYAWRKWRE